MYVTLCYSSQAEWITHLDIKPKATPHNSARKLSERFCAISKFQKRENTVCISRFWNCRNGAKDPLRSADAIVRCCPIIKGCVLSFRTQPFPTNTLRIYWTTEYQLRASSQYTHRRLFRPCLFLVKRKWKVMKLFKPLWYPVHLRWAAVRKPPLADVVRQQRCEGYPVHIPYHLCRLPLPAHRADKSYWS